MRRKDDAHRDTRGEIFGAYAPYLIIIAVFSIAQIGPVKTFLDGPRQRVRLAGAERHQPRRRGRLRDDVQVQLGAAAGTLLLACGFITMLVIRVKPGRALRIYGETVDKLKFATLTVAAVLALAYVMNLSGQTITIGLWIAGAGGILAFLSSIIGWLGVAVTGSDASSNSLFGALQVSAAKEAGPRSDAAGRGQLVRRRAGKMISPQNLAIGAAAVGLGGREGELFRRVIGWSLLLLLIMCVLVYLQSTPVLSWMVV